MNSLSHGHDRVKLGVTLDEEIVEVTAQSEQLGHFSSIVARLNSHAQNDYIYQDTTLLAMIVS